MKRKSWLLYRMDLQMVAMFLNVVNNILEVDGDTMSAAIQSTNASAR